MKPTQAGFTLVELVVTMVMLSLVLLGVAQLTFILARGAATVAGGAARGGILAQQVNQFAAIPFDSLKGKAGTVTVNKPPLPYTRTTTVDSLSPKLRRVTIIITPLNPVFKPDTLVVQRTKPSANPFRTGP
jgi:prepilin-type N-terminal cleavage/methylation domain-containing protein